LHGQRGKAIKVAKPRGLHISAISQRMARSLSVSTPREPSDVADRCGLGLDLLAAGGQESTFRLQGCQNTGLAVSLLHEPPRNFFCPSIADRAALVRPLLAASSIVVSIWARRRSRSGREKWKHLEAH